VTIKTAPLALLALACAFSLPATTRAGTTGNDAAPPQPPANLETLRTTAVDAYNARNWVAAAEAADAFVSSLDAAGLPHAGNDFALVSFVGGHARFELWKQAPETFKWDYAKDVLGAMEKSLTILQDDPFFKHNVIGTAYYERLKADRYQDVTLENSANWHMYKALMARYEELQGKSRDGESYTSFAKYILQYIQRTFEMARYSQVPDLYLVRVREACRMGFATQYDDRFAQLYQVVGFDNGNVRAGVLWQIGLDLMNTEGTKPDEALEVFRQAAEATRGHRERAEVYRQMADYSSRQEGHGFKLQAVEYGRLAFKLDPGNADIQVQYGTSLHVISYAHFNASRFKEALHAAEEATSFEWEGDEVGYFDLSRAQANFGDRISALTNAERAYDKARKKYQGAELQPFRQNYVNVLRQFGLTQKAQEVEIGG
jgi:hypothetical protein